MKKWIDRADVRLLVRAIPDSGFAAGSSNYREHNPAPGILDGRLAETSE